MKDALVFSLRRPTSVKASPRSTMTPGDVLYYLSLLAPDDYRAIETLAREKLKQRWPLEENLLELLRRPTG